MRLSDDVSSMLDGSSALVGAAGNGGKPYCTLGWGPRLDEARERLTIFVEERRSAAVLQSVRENGMIAVTFGDPISYRSLQLKGRDCAVYPLTETDSEGIARHRDSVAANFALTGDPLTGLRNMWMDDLVRLEFTITEAYDQTPGPNAGNPL